jgi:hypothetical protein
VIVDGVAGGVELVDPGPALERVRAAVADERVGATEPG